ncbi:MAG: hypothetical protein P1U68_08790 [Verrucomicrobiales bacterium]|nr:hypothetical protein [Verrucomicrobiales bacterium]
MHPKPQFEELDYRPTPLGELILRRRTILSLNNQEIHEIILGDEYLMSSLFTAVEIALSNLGLAKARQQFPDVPAMDVVVGGLGLGFTAKAALENEGVGSLLVVDCLKPVIEWHEAGLVPLGPELTADDRCRFVHGDFFALSLGKEEGRGFHPEEAGKQFHAVLLDIDHSPDKLLHEQHGAFYSAEGLAKFAGQILPGGVFGMWSDDPPEETFMSALRQVFSEVESHIVEFYNPLQDKTSASTVYVAVKA